MKTIWYYNMLSIVLQLESTETDTSAKRDLEDNWDSIRPSRPKLVASEILLVISVHRQTGRQPEKEENHFFAICPFA